MTFDEARSLFKAPTNPRWVACRAALEREFAPWEFSIWLGRRWREFAALQGCKDSNEVFLKLGSATHGRFDEWMRSHIDAGVPADWRTA